MNIQIRISLQQTLTNVILLEKKKNSQDLVTLVTYREH
jgi:hypothetical protein